MKIWELRHNSNNYVVFCPINKERWTLDYIHSFDGSSKLKDWTKLPVTSDQVEKSLPLTDFLGFLHIPFLVFSDECVKKLYSLIQGDAELLPLEFENSTYYGINVISLLDCVDLANSSFKRYKSTGRIMKFNNLSFRKNMLENHHLFRLTEGPITYYVSDEFKNAVISNGLTGFAFKLIWEG